MIFPGVVVAMRKDEVGWATSVTPMFVEAANKAEALGKLHLVMTKVCPPADGWTKHYVDIGQVDFILDNPDNARFGSKVT